MDKNGFDERQILNRYKIRSQSFFILFFLVIIDAFVRDIGFNWTRNWTTNFGGTFIIAIITITYFDVRAILCDAYYSEKNASQLDGTMIGFLIVALFMIIMFMSRFSIMIRSGQLNQSDWFLALPISFLTTAVVYWIKRAHSKFLKHNAN